MHSFIFSISAFGEYCDCRISQTAKAVAAMVDEPSKSWTFNELADHSNTSRATLVRIFAKTHGLAFLSYMRLILARKKGASSDRPLFTIPA